MRRPPMGLGALQMVDCPRSAMSEPLRPACSAAPRRRYLTILFSDLSDSTGIAEPARSGGLFRSARPAPRDLSPRRRGAWRHHHPDQRRRHARDLRLSRSAARTTAGAPPRRRSRSTRRWPRSTAANRCNCTAASIPGLVLLHEGDEVRGRFELLGSATNIASRLCDLAQAGQILVSEATLGPGAASVRDRERSHLSLKGKEDPVATLAILGRAAARSRYAASVRGGLTPFVGREAELERLLDEPRARRWPASLASSKSRAGRRRQDPPRRGAASAGGRAVAPKSIAANATRPPSRCSPSCRSPGRLAGPDTSADDDVTHGRRCWTLARPGAGTADPVRRRLASCRRCQPGDAGGAARSRHAASSSLLTARPGDGGRMIDFDTLPLAPFSADETAEAVARLLAVARSVPDRRDRAILRRQRLVHRGIVPFDRRRPPQRKRAGRQSLARYPDRIASFAPSRGRRTALVRKAAVIGTIIPAWLLEAITGHGEHDPLVAGLAEQDFIFPGEREGTLRFKHGLTRDAIYASVGLHERRALHLRDRRRACAPAAATMARRSRTRRWLTITAPARTGRPPPIMPSSPATGRWRSRRSTALRPSTRRRWRRSTACRRRTRSPPAGVRIAQRFGLAGVFDPSRDQLAVFERAVERAEAGRDRGALARAEYWLGYINYGLGEAGAAIAHCARAAGRRGGPQRRPARRPDPRDPGPGAGGGLRLSRRACCCSTRRSR